MSAVWGDITDRKRDERDLLFQNLLLTTQQEGVDRRHPRC